MTKGRTGPIFYGLNVLAYPMGRRLRGAIRRLCTPAAQATAWLGRRLRGWLRKLGALGCNTQGVLPLPTLQGLQAPLRQAAQAGVVHGQAAEIACRALAFGSLRVLDVMVPRNHIRALPQDATPAQLQRCLLEDGHSRLPVYAGTLDNVVGILVAKDVLSLAWQEALIVFQDLVQPPYFAPETMHAVDLLKELQRRQLHFAVVVDEMGGTAGIVTLEDLLEELVGDIRGEHDARAPEHIHHEANGTILLEGLSPVREVNRELALRLPEGERFTTVGGLCVHAAGRIPEVGQHVELTDGWVLEVLEASPKHVARVRLQQATSGPPP